MKDKSRHMERCLCVLCWSQETWIAFSPFYWRYTNRKKKKKKREEIKCTNKCKIRHSPVILLSKGLLPWTSRCYHWDIPSNVIHIEIIYYEDNQYLFTSCLFLSPSAWPITSTQHTHTKSLCTLCCHPSSLPEQNQCSAKQYRPIEP